MFNIDNYKQCYMLNGHLSQNPEENLSWFPQKYWL